MTVDASSPEKVGPWRRGPRPPGRTCTSPAGPWLETATDGPIDLLISAPHAAPHIRDGVQKIAESDTGPLARDLATSLEAASIVALEGQLGDPNWDDGHPYVQRLQELQPDAVLDLHIMRPRGPRVCLGTGLEGQACHRLLDPLSQALQAFDVPFSINWPFRGRGRPITSRMQEAGICALQVELAWPVFDDDPESLAVLHALEAGMASVVASPSLHRSPTRAGQEKTHP